MLLSEQELSVEVRLFDVVRVCDDNFSAIFWSSKIYHGIVFKQLASNGTWADQENSAFLHKFGQFLA